MAQDQLDLTPQDTLALSAAMRRPLTDLFTRIRAIAAHEEMLTPYLRQELEVPRCSRCGSSCRSAWRAPGCCWAPMAVPCATISRRRMTWCGEMPKCLCGLFCISSAMAWTPLMTQRLQ